MHHSAQKEVSKATMPSSCLIKRSVKWLAPCCSNNEGGGGGGAENFLLFVHC